MKGYAEAHRHKGGFEKWVYDEIKRMDTEINSLKSQSQENTSEDAGE